MSWLYRPKEIRTNKSIHKIESWRIIRSVIATSVVMHLFWCFMRSCQSFARCRPGVDGDFVEIIFSLSHVVESCQPILILDVVADLQRLKACAHCNFVEAERRSLQIWIFKILNYQLHLLVFSHFCFCTWTKCFFCLITFATSNDTTKHHALKNHLKIVWIW